MITVDTDSYITVAEATIELDEFFDVENWTDATTANKEKALKQATRNIDTQFLRWEKYLETQALQFPRSMCIYGEIGDTTGVVPNKVKIAQALEALSILDNRASASTETEDMEAGIVSRSVKSASVSYDADVMKSVREKAQRPLSNMAKSYLRSWIQTTFTRV